MLALISDIHGNLPALQAVFADIASLGSVDGVFCLGDVVGYGPEPIACIDLVTARCKLYLMGNHEHALIHGPLGFHPAARRAIDWTKRVIDEQPPAKRAALWDLLRSLPHQHQLGEVLLVHGSPRDPVMEYVLESDTWEGADPRKLDECFARTPRLAFFGHTHRPGVFTSDHCFLPASDLPDGFRVDDGKYLINVGSVGQPRDRDPRACYALYTGDSIYFRRVAYDARLTAERLRAVPELDPRFAERLLRGE